MARIKDSIFGGVSGKIGNVVSCCRYGKYYLRTLPGEVRQPNTQKQLSQRMRFALVQELLQSISQHCRVGFGAYAQGRSAYNAAMSANLKNAVTGDYPDLHIDFSKVQVSKGTLAMAANITMQRTYNDSITIAWQNTIEAKTGNHSDKVVVLLLTTTPFSFISSFTDERRMAGQVSIPLPPDWKSTVIHGYLSFITADIITGNMLAQHISDSAYCGEITV